MTNKSINKDVVEAFKQYFKLKEPPIAIFYTDVPPEKVFEPKFKSVKFYPCVIRLLNSVRRGRTLVIGKESRNLCPGGLAYLGFQQRLRDLEYHISQGYTDASGKWLLIDGEKFFKNTQIARELLNDIPFMQSPGNYIVFMPLENVDLERYEPQLVCFFVNMDQLAGLIQLAHFDAPNVRTLVAKSSGCGAIVTEPYAELNKEIPAPIIGLLTDIYARQNVKKEDAVLTLGYKRLIELYNNIDESFLKLEAWKRIQNRID